MRAKSETQITSEQVVKDIRRATRKQYSAEEKIRIGLVKPFDLIETPISATCFPEWVPALPGSGKMLFVGR